MAEKVGFIGLGQMGRPFAANIIKAGFDLVVYDVREEPMKVLAALGAATATSPREVAEHADIIHIAVPHEPEADAVMQGQDGVLAAAHQGTVAVIHSSLHPRNMIAMAEEAKQHGVEVLDVQMSGGARGVEARTLCLMVGGDAATLQRVRPMLETTGEHIFHLGGVGMGAVTKVAQNTMTAMHLLTAAEGFRIAEKGGVDLAVFQEVVRRSAASSYIADDYLHHWAQNDIRWGYYSVLSQALDLAHEYDIAVPGAATCMQALAFALRKP